MQYGITHSSSQYANPAFTPIGDGSLINARNDFLLANGRRLGEYIPFYFGTRTPMLYVIQNGFNMVTPTKPEDVIYCVTSIKKIQDLGLDFVFTDGHAVDSFSAQYQPVEIENIDSSLDWVAIRSKYWKDELDLDKKRRKEAEFLVLGDISIGGILGFYVYNEAAKNKLIELGAEERKIIVKPEYYF